MTDKRTVMGAAWSIIEKIAPPHPTYPPSRTAPLEQRIAELEAEANKTCKWKPIGHNEYDYQLGCGDTYSMEKPLFNYCPDCGGKVVVSDEH